MPADWWAFIVVATILVMSPGADSVLIVRNSLAGGRGVGLATVAGVQAGVVAHTVLAVTGLSALLYWSPSLFRLLSVVGALYLAWIGLSIMRQQSVADVAENGGEVAASMPAAFRQGMLCNVLNPKVIILFVALMPAFVDIDADAPKTQLIILAATLLAINTPFQMLLAACVGLAANHRWYRRHGHLLQYFLGGVLLAIAVAFFIEHAWKGVNP